MRHLFGGASLDLACALCHPIKVCPPQNKERVSCPSRSFPLSPLELLSGTCKFTQGVRPHLILASLMRVPEYVCTTHCVGRKAGGAPSVCQAFSDTSLMLALVRRLFSLLYEKSLRKIERQGKGQASLAEIKLSQGSLCGEDACVGKEICWIAVLHHTYVHMLTLTHLCQME